MAIDAYPDLLEAISGWLNKGTTLDSRIPDFVQLAEARLRRVLDANDQDIIGTVTITGNSGPLPADFGSLRSIATTTWGRLDEVSASQFADYQTIAGIPRSYAIIGGQIFIAPSSSGTINIVYKQGLPALAAVNTNWLLTRHPDAYLYASLLQAEAFLWNDERIPLWKSALDEALNEIRADNDNRRWGAAPLSPRLRRT